MAFCRYCGKEINGYQKYCAYCGGEQVVSNVNVKQEEVPVDTAPVVEPKVESGNTSAENAPATQNKSDLGWGALGCCVPVAGLILYLIWKSEKPNSAKAAGIGALIGFGVNLLVTIISTVIGVLSGL